MVFVGEQHRTDGEVEEKEEKDTTREEARLLGEETEVLLNLKLSSRLLEPLSDSQPYQNLG